MSARKTTFRALTFMACALVLISTAGLAGDRSLDLPSSKWGISIGNSRTFTGLRLNYRDCGVDHVNGVNITLWQPCKTNQEARISGLSLGMLPGGGRLSGIQLGLLGIAATLPMLEQPVLALMQQVMDLFAVQR